MQRYPTLRRVFALGILAIFDLGASAVVIGPKLASLPQVDPGEVLIAELNCVSCHSTSQAIPDARNSRPSPGLGKDGMRISPQYLRSFLEDPSNYKSGTTMPDMLHHFGDGERSETVDALVHYLVSEQSEPTAKGVSADEILFRKGQSLFHTVGCVACHAPQASPEAVPGLTPEDPKLEQFDRELEVPGSIPLGELARKTTVDELARFLMDPVKVRPSGRMPSHNLNAGEAMAIAAYLLRAQATGPSAPKPSILSGLKFHYYEDQFGPNPDFEALSPKASGVVNSFDVSSRQREEFFGYRYSGFIRIPKEGRYSFFVESDDGGRLYLDGKLLVDNGGDHAPQEKSATVELPAGDHPLVVTYHNNGAGFAFAVAWQAPGGKKEAIPAELLTHVGTPMVPLDPEQFTMDEQKVRRGREHFNALGCAACHTISGSPLVKPNLKPIDELPAEEQGCLAERAGRGVPRFGFSHGQREQVISALRKGRASSGQRSAAQQVRYTLAQMNCLACHTRDGTGGPLNSRLAYFRTSGEVDLGDEGRIPPHLTEVGAKLRTEAINDVVFGKSRVRPYMATRMPQFTPTNFRELPEDLARADARPDAFAEPETSLRDTKFGRRLVGQGGLTCIACHTFAGHKSQGIPAVNMMAMAPRLRFDWFKRYLVDPPSLRPGTRMPSFWPGGEAVNKEILDGHTDAQITAIWSYLASRPETDLPPGLVQGSKEIVVEREPVIYRNFIAGAGTRAIAVGYPEKVNLAFDANQIRLAMIWQGAFIDAARHSSGRGEGFEPPLGHNIFSMPEGPQFAVLSNGDAAWPSTSGRDAGFRMGGYSLDEKGRPTFFYTFHGVEVHESYEPVSGELDAYFKRTLRVSGDLPRGLWFRAASGEVGERDGKFVVNGKITMSFPGSAAQIRGVGTARELLVPVGAGETEAVVVQEIIW